MTCMLKMTSEGPKYKEQLFCRTLPEAYLQPTRTSTKKLFFPEIGSRPKVANYFNKKASS